MEYIGYIKYQGPHIKDGLFGAREAAVALNGFDEVFRYFLAKEEPEFAKLKYDLPNGYEKSMTELEYDEAQRLGLPSYIFILDEQNGVVAPSSIDFENRDKLLALKRKLMNKTVEFFTTPEDLANKVGTAIHRAMKEGIAGIVTINKGIENVIQPKTELPGITVLRRFEILPQRWTGIELTLEIDNFITNGTLTPNFIDIKEADEIDCRMFGLVAGEAIITNCFVRGTNKKFLFVTDCENAYSLIDADFYATFTILGETMSFYEPSNNELVLAVKIKRVLNVKHVSFSDEPDIPF
jgi:hypothetical protein